MEKKKKFADSGHSVYTVLQKLEAGVENKILGNWKLIQEIGSGPHGTLYKGEHSGKGTAYLKFIPGAIQKQSEAGVRFLKEIELLQTTESPYLHVWKSLEFVPGGIITVEDVLQGTPLSEYLKVHRLSPIEALNFVRQLALGLDVIHNAGIIHGSIKLNNCWIDDDKRNICLLDTGIRIVSGLSLLFDAKIRNNDTSIGYMSPEMSGMLNRPVDYRTDLYSLGILFYQLVTGDLPYWSDQPGEIIHQHIAKTPENPAAIVQNLPPIIGEIIEKLIKKDPEDRYQSAHGLAEDLSQILALDPNEIHTFSMDLGKKDKLKNISFRTRLIGRKDEMRNIDSKLSRKDKGSISVFLSKAGFGKTRLLEYVAQAGESAGYQTVFIHSYAAEENHPYGAFEKACRKILQSIDSFAPETREQAHRLLRVRLGSKGAILLELFPSLEQVVSQPDNETGTTHFLDTFVQLFLVFSEIFPLVLVMDDVQNWDEGSKQVLKKLTDSVSTSPIHVFLGLRDREENQSSSILETMRGDVVRGVIALVDVKPLTQDQVKDFITEVFGGLSLGLPEITQKIFQVCQGNPFFVGENLRRLVDSQVIVKKSDEWLVDLKKLENFEFIGTLLENIQGRLDSLTQDQRLILWIASILGRDFTFSMVFSMVQQVNGKPDAGRVLEYLKDAEKALILDSIVSESGGFRYRFVHEEFIRSLLNELSGDKLKNLHKLAAEIIERDYDGKDKVYRLAHHYIHADIRTKAYTSCTRAAKQAMDSYSFQSALMYYLHALDILRNHAKQSPSAEQSRIQLSYEIVQLYFQLGEYQKNIELLNDLAETGVQSENQQDLAKSYYYLAKNYFFLGNQVKAMEYYHKVIPIAQAARLPELLAVPYCAIGRAHCFIGNFTQSIEYITKGLELLPQNEFLEQIYSLGILAQSHGYLGHKKIALELIEKLENTFGSTKNEMFQLYVQFYKASILSMVGDPQKVLEEGRKCVDLAREQNNLALELFCYNILGAGYTYLGNTEQAISFISRALRLAEDNHISVGIALVYYSLSELYGLTGQKQLVVQTLEKGLQHSALVNPKLIQQWDHRIQSLLHCSKPGIRQAQRAEDEILKAVELSRALGPDYRFIEAQNLMILAYLQERLGKTQESKEIHDRGLGIIHELEMDGYEGYLVGLRTRILNPENLESVHPFDVQKETLQEFSYQRQVQYLIRLSEQLSQVLVMDELLPRILSLALEVIGAESAGLFLVEEDEKGPSKVKLKSHSSLQNKNEGFPYSQILVEDTLRQASGRLIHDAQVELSEDPVVKLNGLRSIVTAPLITGGKVHGVLYLDNRQVKGLFSQENFELLKSFGVQAAIALENARLYEESRETLRVQQELEIASDIQTSILPVVRDVEGYEIAAFMRTAAEVGGDYFDFDFQSLPNFGVFGDVSGHGLKSGLIMMMAETVFQTLMTDFDNRNKPLGKLYQTINNVLHKNVHQRLSQRSRIGDQYDNMYMTMRLFRFDKEGNFEMFGNDHAEPLICRAHDGSIETVASTGFLLGITEDAVRQDVPTTFTLERGDLLIFYSDGITEAKNQSLKDNKDKSQARAMFGEGKLHTLIANHRHRSPKKIIDTVIRVVDSWISQQDDDITMVVIKKQ